MGTYCSSSTNINQQTLDYLKNKIYEVRYLKIIGEEPYDWKFDCFWKKRLKENIPKNPSNKVNFPEMAKFVTSFPEMKKHRTQKILKDTKNWPYVCMGLVKSTYKIDPEDSEFLDNSQKEFITSKPKINLKSPYGNNNKQSNLNNSNGSDSENSNLKEFIGQGILIGNSIVLTLVKNIYLILNQNKKGQKFDLAGNVSKYKEIKAEEVKFYCAFNGNMGIECEIDSIHHLGYDNIEEIGNDIALLFLKKPIGEDFGFLGISEDIDIPKFQSVETVGYLFDDFYENKIFLNEMKMQIVKEDSNKNNSNYRSNSTNSNLNNNNNNNNLKYKEIYGTNNSIKNNNGVNGNINNNNNTYNTNFSEMSENNFAEELSEFFFFDNTQGFNMLPGAGIWANKHNKHFLLGLYLGKNEKNIHYGRFLNTNISNIKEWILDYWFENKKENTKILIGGEDFKLMKNEALDGIVEKFKNLNNVNLNNSNLNDQDVHLLVKNLTLNVLKIRNNNLSTDTAIYIANNQRNIEELDLSYNNIGYVGIKEIAWKMRKIKVFLLEKTGLKDNSLSDISANLIDLAVLDISRNFVTNKGIENLALGNINLSELYIGYNNEITDKAIEFISENIFKLVVLGLNDLLISDESICLIASRLLFIKKLNLYKCNITDYGLTEIVDNLKYLENLNITLCNNISDDFKKYLVKSKIVKNVIM